MVASLSTMHLTNEFWLFHWQMKSSQLRGRQGCQRMWPRSCNVWAASAELWHHRLKKLREMARIYGVVFGVTRHAISRFAESKGGSRLVNTTG